MSDWQVTAATIHCEAVADDVTIIVYPDWSTKCSGLVKYTSDRDASIALVKRSLKLRQSLDCLEAGCTYISEYVARLRSEETVRKAPPDRSH